MPSVKEQTGPSYSSEPFRREAKSRNWPVARNGEDLSPKGVQAKRIVVCAVGAHISRKNLLSWCQGIASQVTAPAGCHDTSV